MVFPQPPGRLTLMMMLRESSLGRKMQTLRRSCMTLLLWKVSLFILVQAGGSGWVGGHLTSGPQWPRSPRVPSLWARGVLSPMHRTPTFPHPSPRPPRNGVSSKTPECTMPRPPCIPALALWLGQCRITAKTKKPDPAVLFSRLGFRKTLGKAFLA